MTYIPNKHLSVSELNKKINEGPVFLNFTADWCITCKVNEKTTKKVKECSMGGFLVNKNNYDKYVILSTAPNTGVINSIAKTWTVQVKGAKFYRKLGYDEMKAPSLQEIDDLYEQIDILKKEVKKLKEKKILLKNQLDLAKQAQQDYENCQKKLKEIKPIIIQN